MARKNEMNKVKVEGNGKMDTDREECVKCGNKCKNKDDSEEYIRKGQEFGCKQSDEELRFNDQMAKHM